MTISPNGPLRIGIGGPVGSGKTALMEALCKAFRDRYDVCAITNDIYTKEDALILTRAGALPEERIMGVETGGCPHTAIREDASINLAAIIEMKGKFPKLDLILIESGGDNLVHYSLPCSAREVHHRCTDGLATAAGEERWPVARRVSHRPRWTFTG